MISLGHYQCPNGGGRVQIKAYDEMDIQRRDVNVLLVECENRHRCPDYKSIHCTGVLHV